MTESFSKAHFPTIFVLFGATGDLAIKKIIPALFDLFAAKKLPPLFNVVGFSRRAFSHDDYRGFIAEIVRKYKGAACSDEELKKFLKIFWFISGRFDASEDYRTLGAFLGNLDGEWKTCANKLFYLSVSPEFYKTICLELSRSHLTDPCSPEEGWTRVIVEKPFGKDLKTAEELDRLLGKLFEEVQIYRIDHYLAKEMIQNILTFRFSNDLFEHQWNRNFIERIDIRVWETLGVEERGAFYDGVGALRDVGQNHLLQMLAFVTMREPKSLDSFAIRAERADLLRKLIPITVKEMPLKTARAQYEGYRTIKDVDSSSMTETYFKVMAEVDDDEWRGVPITIESGKRMGERRKEIIVYFKHPAPCFCPPNTEHQRNRVIFSMEPHEGITIEFWSKKPGLSYQLEQRSFDFLLRGNTRHTQYVEEYQKLLMDCIEGDQTLFVSTDEMNAMWKFVDPIVSAWRKNTIPLASYPPDTSLASDQALPAETSEGTSAPLKEIGIVGLGKMGANLARRLHSQGWRVVGYNRSFEVSEALANEGVLEAVSSLQELGEKLGQKRCIWLMVPAGKPVDEMLFGKGGLTSFLKAGDTVIDGGNSHYLDDGPRAKKLAAKKIQFLDVGTSGGPKGALEGPCLMIGGTETAFKRYEVLFRDLSKNGSYAFFPGVGAGHFVKMVHNGIEYGMMQALAEGMAVLKKSAYRIDLSKVAWIYNEGSVIASRLVGWLISGFKKHGQDLKDISSTVAHTGEGAWTVEAGKKLKVPTPIIAGSLQFRKKSARNKSYTGKVLSLLRGEFGGHSTK